MQFLYPTFLWALAALTIPIIVHLFYFRRFKKVSFTNVRLLKEIKEETASRNKLKDLLILLSRLLAMAFLIFAFTQPFLPRGENVKKGTNAVSVFVDNSFSMNALSNQVPIIDVAKEKAREIINAYGESDNFQILTHDFEGRHQRLVTKEDALSLIDEIQSSPAVKEIQTILNRQEQILSKEKDNKISYILSDFQESLIPDKLAFDSTTEVNLVPIQSIQENNVSIDSAWLEAGVAFIGQENKLAVKIHNYGEAAVENIRLSIVKDGQEKPEGRFNIPARSTVTDTINLSILTPGWHTAEIKISDYPVQFDDSYWVSFYVDEELDILVVNNGRNNRFLKALFDGLPNYRLTSSTANTINYGELNKYKLIIIHNLASISSGMSSSLKTYVEGGGKVLLFPDVNSDVSSINAFLSNLRANELGEYSVTEKQVSRINSNEFIFSDVYENTRRNLTLPKVSASYKLTRFQSRAEEQLMTFRDGSPFLTKYQNGNGLLYLCTSPIDNEINNLVLNAEVFVPMVFKMAIASANYEPISYVIGSNTPIVVAKDPTQTDIIYNMTGETQFIPSQVNLGNIVLLNDNGQVKNSGIHNLTVKNRLIKKIAYNYDRKESNLTIYDLDKIDGSANIIDNSLSADFTTLISEKDKGVVLWKWCLIFALIFFALETLLLRFWKK